MPETPDFLGHEEQLSRLERMRRAGRLPHALLFTGPDGIGKEKIGTYLAKAILCEEKAAPCGHCASCDLIREGKHPEFLKLIPEDGRIKIDSIRELKKNFNFPPLIGNSRVVLIRDAHRLNVAAANALLKILEEPPQEVYFILVSHALGWIPRTIVSRSQKFNFHPLSEDQVRGILEKLGASVSPQILRSAQGSPLKAQQLKQVEGEIPDVRALSEGKGLSYDEAYELSLKIVEEEKIPQFLEGLLAQSHALLTRENSHEGSFDLLRFTDKILEFQRMLRLNLNPKVGLMRIMLYFREAREIRL